MSEDPALKYLFFNPARKPKNLKKIISKKDYFKNTLKSESIT